MNTLEKTIQTDLVQAMKNHQEHTVSALRSIKTSIMETKTAPGGKKDLEDGDIIKIIQKLVKQRKESMDIYSQAGRQGTAGDVCLDELSSKDAFRIRGGGDCCEDDCGSWCHIHKGYG